MKNNVKIIIACVFFAIAGLVIAYQLGMFDSKKKPAASSPAAAGQSGEIPEGTIGVGSDVFQKPTG